MGPYSHLIIASRLASQIKPDNPGEYYWGAVAPDARYTAKLRRSKTHISTPQIMGFIHQYPHLKSFLQGYLVHCISDKIFLGRLLFPYFPFTILRGFVPNPLIVVMLELYNFEREQVQVAFSNAHNEVFTSLGLSEADTAKYGQFLSQYTAAAPLETRLTELAQFFGLGKSRNIDGYLRAVKRFQENRLLKKTSFLGIRAARMSDRIAEKVLYWLPEGTVGRGKDNGA